MGYPHEDSKPVYGNCDSFFIETDDYGIFTRRIDGKEQARIDAQEKQRAIAEELSRITANELQQDILEHMQQMELVTLPDVNSIDIQTEIEWFMRPYLLDFLVEAHAAFSLLPETLYLTINLLDRYCSRRIVYKRHYQLVGCAALLIASKYGDKKERVPQIKELRSMCCSLYEDEMFTQMEWHVLQTLNWTIGHPTVDSFLQIAMADVPSDPEVEHMAWYITELAFFHKEFVSTLPSMMARSALFLARYMLSRAQIATTEWTAGSDPWLVNRLYMHMQQPSPVVSKKYAGHSLSSVSITASMFVQRQAEMERRRMAQQTAIDMESLFVEKPCIDTLANPRTPQKPLYAAQRMHGLYTPPITPDNGLVNQTYLENQVPNLPACPATPSSPTTLGVDSFQPHHCPTHTVYQISPQHSQ